MQQGSTTATPEPKQAQHGCRTSRLVLRLLSASSWRCRSRMQQLSTTPGKSWTSHLQARAAAAFSIQLALQVPHARLRLVPSPGLAVRLLLNRKNAAGLQHMSFGRLGNRWAATGKLQQVLLASACNRRVASNADTLQQRVGCSRQPATELTRRPTCSPAMRRRRSATEVDAKQLQTQAAAPPPAACCSKAKQPPHLMQKLLATNPPAAPQCGASPLQSAAPKPITSRQKSNANSCKKQHCSSPAPAAQQCGAAPLQFAAPSP